MSTDAVLYAALRAKIASRHPAANLPALGPDWRALGAWHVRDTERRKGLLRYAWHRVFRAVELRLLEVGLDAVVDTWLHGRCETAKLADLAERIGGHAPVIRLLLHVHQGRTRKLLAHHAYADVHAVLVEQRRIAPPPT